MRGIRLTHFSAWELFVILVLIPCTSFIWQNCSGNTRQQAVYVPPFVMLPIKHIHQDTTQGYTGIAKGQSTRMAGPDSPLFTICLPAHP